MISVRVTGIDSLMRKVDRMTDRFSERNREFLDRLARIGVDTARVRFRNAQYDGVNDVIVREPEWTSENSLCIHADGFTVAFIEFGTGVHYAEQHPLAGDLDIRRGSYGYHMGRFDSWKYRGAPGTNGEPTDGDWVWTHGNPPARAMYDAGKEMRDKIQEIAKEVFGRD